MVGRKTKVVKLFGRLFSSTKCSLMEIRFFLRNLHKNLVLIFEVKVKKRRKLIIGKPE